MARVIFDGVSKVFDGDVRAVDCLDLVIEDDELLVLVGPSGCGKTTSLRMLAGLEDVSGGVIKIGDRVVNNVPTKQRNVAMVFQNYSLYPHMTVKENMAFGLKMRKGSSAMINEKVDRAAKVLDLVGLLGRLPKQLSGGQRQRVAMGRAIVREPQVFLMDEPLSNLDAKLRGQMRAEIAQLQRRLSVATLYVTHDQVEAMTLGDRVAVMHEGVLQQVADPHEIYTKPRNIFVASFIGAPSMNLVESLFDIEDGEGVCRFGGHEIRVPGAILSSHPRLVEIAGSPVGLGIRPEGITNGISDRQNEQTISSEVQRIEYLGSDTLAHIIVAARDVSGISGESDKIKAREPRLTNTKEKTTLVIRCDPKVPLQRGQGSTFTVNVERLHFFDLSSGLAI